MLQAGKQSLQRGDETRASVLLTVPTSYVLYNDGFSGHLVNHNAAQRGDCRMTGPDQTCSKWRRNQVSNWKSSRCSPKTILYEMEGGRLYGTVRYGTCLDRHLTSYAQLGDLGLDLLTPPLHRLPRSAGRAACKYSSRHSTQQKCSRSRSQNPTASLA